MRFSPSLVLLVMVNEAEAKSRRLAKRTRPRRLNVLGDENSRRDLARDESESPELFGYIFEPGAGTGITFNSPGSGKGKGDGSPSFSPMPSSGKGKGDSKSESPTSSPQPSGGKGKGKGDSKSQAPSTLLEREPGFTVEPSISEHPSSEPSHSIEPSVSAVPSNEPSVSMEPSVSSFPSNVPSVSQVPSISQEPSLSSKPSISLEPSFSVEPSLSLMPSSEPSVSQEPSVSLQPSGEPSISREPSISAVPSFSPSSLGDRDPPPTLPPNKQMKSKKGPDRTSVLCSRTNIGNSTRADQVRGGSATLSKCRDGKGSPKYGGRKNTLAPVQPTTRRLKSHKGSHHSSRRPREPQDLTEVYTHIDGISNRTLKASGGSDYPLKTHVGLVAILFATWATAY